MMRTTNIMAMSAAAVLLMASCSKDQVTQENPGNAIRLKAFTQASSKATATETADVLDFTAVAFDANSALYFSDTYSRNSGTASFVAEGGTHYWPTDGSTLTFIGHSPADLSPYLEAGFSVNGAALSGAGISGIKPKQHADEQVDLLVYRNQGNGTQNGASGLGLYMHHAFSRIIVQAQNENSNMEVKVIGVKIGRIKGVGTLEYPTSVTTSNGPISLPRWNTSTNELNSYIAGAKAASGESQPATEAVSVAKKTPEAAEFSPTNLMFGEESFMVIPQAVTSWTGSQDDASGAYIAVLCQISSDNGSGVKTQLFPAGADNVGRYAYSAVPIPASTTWLPGYQYTYTLRFFADGTGGGGLEPPVDPTDPPVDPTPVDPNPGQPVVGGAISLSVTVHNWIPDSSLDAGTEMGGNPTTPSSSQVRK